MILPSATFGGPATSLVTLACHSGLPLVSNASTSPLSVPTAIVATRADAGCNGLSALMRQFCRPVAGSTRTIVPSGLAA